MNLKQISLLTGLSAATVIGSGCFMPAHAIQVTYTITNGSGVFGSGTSISGNFKYDATTNTYSNVSISVSGNGAFSPFTYNYISSGNANNNSTLGGGLGDPISNTYLSLGQIISSNPNGDYRYLNLKFASQLPTQIGTSIGLFRDSNSLKPTNEIQEFSGDASGRRLSLSNNVTITATATATAVPFETDVLPVVGATLAFGGGIFAKKKLAQKKMKNLNIETANLDDVSINA
ncbi:hypothetical protein H6F32_15710 [Anabaena sp. FACHB-1237]|uniref:hypothetical protein n=1 Tax=Anabaena sp. FACHB-1237 TaxID=2692769 RepID=UPI00168095F0|nr:hypothetical protein [Anabaena sp. FACHB-1237]MBD2138983.1 hypothetical protein [Anabaena sp. FACHB-1237]